jgi:hypothetical protein
MRESRAVWKADQRGKTAFVCCNAGLGGAGWLATRGRKRLAVKCLAQSLERGRSRIATRQHLIAGGGSLHHLRAAGVGCRADVGRERVAARTLEGISSGCWWFVSGGRASGVRSDASAWWLGNKERREEHVLGHAGRPPNENGVQLRRQRGVKARYHVSEARLERKARAARPRENPSLRGRQITVETTPSSAATPG